MVKRQIDERTLAALIDAGVVCVAIITPEHHQGNHKWAIQVRYGMNIQALWSKREPIRLFNAIDSVVKLLHSCGLHQMNIDYS